jgi:hypothetical protein
VPSLAPDETRERWGARAPCAVCESPIRPDQVRGGKYREQIGADSKTRWQLPVATVP